MQPSLFFLFFSIPPVVSDSFITSQRRAAPDKGISTPRKELETGPAVKRRPLVSSGAQRGAVIKGSRAAADPRSPKSAPPKRKEAQRELGWAVAGRRGLRDAADPTASTRSSD